MGGPKALLTLGGETLLRRAAKITLAAGCSPVIAVVGPWESGLGDLEVQAIVNAEAQEGMASSIRTGIAALPEAVEAVLILTVDQPGVNADLIRGLLSLGAMDPARAVACAYGGSLGVPALLPRRLFPELLALRGDQGAKAILLREQAVALPFPAGTLDLDTPEDLERLRRLSRALPG
ncbi:MAG: nucleotidyltransferase family protein [Holophagaceae bacterium]|uniref:Nucleotidyltransferase family protein n=1 Tax=Candidatus Geothrix skivensis TaxID=2954439 RepID=A0A9D7SFM8_9BACT|nr:nucleotidyltransferase family protein [Candidatus Geothrix skivensis]